MATEQNKSILGKRTFCVITGATRGIGQEICSQLSKKVALGSYFLITGRNEQLLAKTHVEIENNNEKANVKVLSFDLGEFAGSVHQNNFEITLRKIIQEWGPFQVAILVHNAGTLGDIGKTASDFIDSKEIRAYLEVNLVSFILVNNLVLKELSGAAAECVVVNITSLLAIMGAPTYAVYAAGRHTFVTPDLTVATVESAIAYCR